MLTYEPDNINPFTVSFGLGYLVVGVQVTVTDIDDVKVELFNSSEKIVAVAEVRCIITQRNFLVANHHVYWKVNNLFEPN